MSHANRRAHYSIRESAWILGVERSTLSRAIRLGLLRTERRRGHHLVPAHELARLLGEPVDAQQQIGGAHGDL